jgi:hypothetical protein
LLPERVSIATREIVGRTSQRGNNSWTPRTPTLSAANSQWEGALLDADIRESLTESDPEMRRSTHPIPVT